MSRRLATLVALGLALAACGRKQSAVAPEVSGLAAVPASAQTVVAIDVQRVLAAPLISRAIDQLVLRDANLAARWQQLRDACKLDVDQIKHVMLAIGPHAGPQPGTGPVLVVATGKISETALATCVRGLIGQGSGSLNTTQVDGKTMYEARDGNRVMYFAFGRADTVVLGSSEAYVTEALGTGKKLLDDPDFKRWIELANQKSPIWAAGHVDERVRQGLLRELSGKLSQGPVAEVLAFDPTSGAKLSVGLVMASDADAKTLESYAKEEKGLLGYFAQKFSLGKLVDRIQIAAEGAVLRLRLELDADDINQLISALDGGGAPAQGSPPAPSSGAGSGSQR
ncbi:MAG TPA: hypothetical protein VLX92_30055 [Kofleriaceae bacterium]|nr:hypothetical protein [Kofleriaceae bacterium]